MPFVKLLYPLLGLYWVAVLLALMLWRRHLCRDRLPDAVVTRPVAYSLELETGARYFNLLFWVLVLTFVPVYTTLSYARFRGPLAIWVLTVVGAALTLIGLVRAYRQLNAIHRLRAERDGNVIVAQKLKQDLTFEHRLFHDLPAGGEGFIDHVLVGPDGVHAIDSRVLPELAESRGAAEGRVVVDGTSLSFPPGPSPRDTRYTTAIARKARWLRTRLATEAGEYTAVRPVLVLTGWQVETARQGTDVDVMSDPEVASLPGRKRVLSPTEVHRVTAQLERMSRGRPRPDRRKHHEGTPRPGFIELRRS